MSISNFFQVNVVLKTSGLIVELRTNEGWDVRKGDLIARQQ